MKRRVFLGFLFSVMDSDGKNQRRLTNKEQVEMIPKRDWHNFFLFINCLYFLCFGYNQMAVAELKIYYMTGPPFEPKDLWVMNADGSNKKLFMKPPVPGAWMYAPQLSPDGKKILFTTQSRGLADAKLMIMNFDGTQLQELLAEPPRNVNIMYGRWSPDGKRIVYRFHSHQDPIKDGLYITDAQGRTSFRIASDIKDPYNPSWFPDSQRIAFIADFPPKFYIVNASPNAKAELMKIQLGAVFHINWSRDGKRTIIEGSPNFGERNELLLGDEMGRNLIRLTNDNDDQSGADWLPDGRHIVYTTHSEPPMDVAIMDVETKEVTRLTKDGQSGFAFWYDDSMVFSVNPLGKLSTSWGKIKARY